MSSASSKYLYVNSGKAMLVNIQRFEKGEKEEKIKLNINAKSLT